MRMSQEEIQRLWHQIHVLDAQLAPYRRTEDEADSQLRQALRDGSHPQILAAYDHRLETRHCNWTLTHHLVDERRWLLSQLPKPNRP